MNKKIAMPLFLLFLIASCLTIPLPVKAQARTIIVPDDFLMISDAIQNATDGDTVLVKRGTYYESTLTIDKAIWLKGEDPLTTKINLNPKWIEYENPIPFQWDQQPHYENALDVIANDVKISGFFINNNVTSMGGLYVVVGNRTQITGNIIQNNAFHLSGSYQVFALNTVNGSIECYSSQYNVIAGNKVSGDIWVNNPSEFMVAPHITNLICGNTVTNGNGIAVGGDGNVIFNNKVMNNSYGIGTAIYASYCIFCSNKVINNDIGIRGTSEGHDNSFFGNQVTGNHYGVIIANIWGIGKNNVLYHNNFVNNSKQVNTDRVIVGTDRNWTAYHGGSFDNGANGNYWSNYNGTDANHNGLGDVPYVIDANRRDNYPFTAPFNISSVSINLPEWASAYSAVVYKEPPLEPQASLPQVQESFPVNPVIILVSLAAIVSIGLTAYFKRLKRNC